MQLTLIAILAICLPLQSLAQAPVDGQRVIHKKCGTEHARLWLGKYGKKYPELFHSIRVLDARPDTSRIGIVDIGTSAQDEILLEGPAAGQLSEYLNATYARHKGDRALLLVLKDLWIASTYHFHFHVEAWLQSDEDFAPLISMDTTIDHLAGESGGIVAEKAIRAVFEVLMDRIAASDLARERRAVSADQIASFNLSRFAYRMDTTTQLKKGAYRSVEEFLDNAPSIEKAEIRSDATASVEVDIPDESGHLYYSRNVWGFCDGSEAYVMMDGNLFPIFRIHHQFFVLGAKEIVYHVKRKVMVPLVIEFGLPGVVIGMAMNAPIDQTMEKNLRIYRVNTGSGQVIE